MQNVCLIVTGASRGFGRAVAITLCRHLIENGLDSADNSRFSNCNINGDSRNPAGSTGARRVHAVLVARSELGLRETENRILRSFTEANHRELGQNTIEDAPLTVATVVTDLSDLTTLDGTIDDILKHCNALLLSAQQRSKESRCRIIFINNAGSLGHIGLCTDTSSVKDLQQAIDLNVTSSLWMSLKIKQWVERNDCVSARIVNISSLCAVQPMPTMALYSAGKAARDAYHSAMAQEHISGSPVATAATTTTSSSPAMSNANLSHDRIRILNYAPGPLETDMTALLRKCDTLDATLQPHFRKQLVDPMDSAAVLSRLVLRDDATYASGAHVDYYDCLPK